MRYDPERLDMIEIYLNGKFRQRAKALEITPNRAPRDSVATPEVQNLTEKTDYLGWLTQKHRARVQITPARKNSGKTEFVNLLRQRLDPEIFDEPLAAEFFETYGPFDMDRLEGAIDTLLAVHPPNLHLSFYLDCIHNQLLGAER